MDQKCILQERLLYMQTVYEKNLQEKVELQSRCARMECELSTARNRIAILQVQQCLSGGNSKAPKVSAVDKFTQTDRTQVGVNAETQYDVRDCDSDTNGLTAGSPFRADDDMPEPEHGDVAMNDVPEISSNAMTKDEYHRLIDLGPLEMVRIHDVSMIRHAASTNSINLGVPNECLANMVLDDNEAKELHQEPVHPVCNACNEPFLSAEELKNHIDNRRGKLFACSHPNCGKLFTYKCSLRKHKLSHRISAPSSIQTAPSDDATSENRIEKLKFYRCNYGDCEETFRLKDCLMDHVKVHLADKCSAAPSGCYALGAQQQWKCQYVGCELKLFPNKLALDYHVMQHRAQYEPARRDIATTSRKRFECGIGNCGKTFATKYIMASHMRKEHRARVFVCHKADCGNSFKSNFLLQRHKIESGHKYHKTEK